MASLVREEKDAANDAFLQGIQKQVKKLSKKIEKIEKHEAKYSTATSKIPPNIAKIIFEKPSLISKISVYKSIISDYTTQSSTKNSNSLSSSTHPNNANDSATASFINLYLAYHTLQLPSQQTDHINDTIGAQYIHAINILWESTSKAPSKNVGSLQNRFIQTLKALSQNQDAMIPKTEITYKQLNQKLQEIFQNQKMINFEINPKQKIEEHNSLAEPDKFIKVESHQDIKEIATRIVEENKNDDKLLESSVINDWAGDAIARINEQATKCESQTEVNVEEKKEIRTEITIQKDKKDHKENEEEEWMTEQPQRRRRRSRNRRRVWYSKDE